MRTITEILGAIVFGAITLGIDYGMSFKALSELHDTVRMEALTKIAWGLTPTSVIVKQFNGGELKDSWLKPVPPEELGSAIRGVPPIIPPRDYSTNCKA